MTAATGSIPSDAKHKRHVLNMGLLRASLLAIRTGPTNQQRFGKAALGYCEPNDCYMPLIDLPTGLNDSLNTIALNDAFAIDRPALERPMSKPARARLRASFTTSAVVYVTARVQDQPSQSVTAVRPRTPSARRRPKWSAACDWVAPRSH